ncbi:MAG: hypothetical protein U0797_02395 [Gemmataceae bacterium]
MATELTAVLFALRREARYWRGPGRRIPGAPCPAWSLGDSLVALSTGVGEVAAGAAIDWLLAARPRLGRVITAGFCGGLTDGWNVGDVARPGRALAAGQVFPLSGDASVAICSVSRPVVTPEERSRLHRATGAHVVDMETATIARRCAAAGVVCESLRVVSDDSRTGLPPDLMAALDGERVRVGRLLLSLLWRPGLAVDLGRLERDSRRAARALAAALDGLLR